MSNAKDLLELKRKSLRLGLCGVYKTRWDEARSFKDLFDLSLDSNGITYLADGIAFGWGLTSDYITETFGEYVNGYVSHQKGYTSQMFVRPPKGTVLDMRSTLNLIVDYDGVVYVPRHMVCRIYVTGDYHICVKCDGKCEVTIYEGNNISSDACVVVDGSFKGYVRINTVSRSEWAS